MSLNVLIFGHVCIDHNVSEHSTYTSFGSPAMFMTKILRGFDKTRPTIISYYGKNYLRYLNGLSIYPTRPNNLNTLVYRNITKGKKRQQYAFYRTNSNPVTIDKMLTKIIGLTDILVFAPLLPNFSPSYINQIIRYAKKNTLKIMLPQGYFRDFQQQGKVILREFQEIQELVNIIDFFILSDQDCPNIFETGKQWIKHSNAKVIVTQGEKGASIIDNSKIVRVATKPVFPMEIVDSVGSGDIFGASFAYSYYHSRDLIKSIEFANQIARKCLSYTPDQISKLKFQYQMSSHI